MTNPNVTIAAFADELVYNAYEHAAFFGRRNMPISTRWFSFDDATKAETFWQLPYDEAKALSVKLKDEGKIKHVCTATDDELKQYMDILSENGAKVWDIGSMLGKQYLGNPTSMAGTVDLVQRIMAASKVFGTDKVRVFNFYPGTAHDNLATPGTDEYGAYVAKAAKEVIAFTSALNGEGIIPLVEVEANLIGRNGDSLASFYDMTNPDRDLKLLMYFDGGNIVFQDDSRQGLSLNTYISMAPYLGGMHIKDCTYKGGKTQWPFVDAKDIDMATGKMKEGAQTGAINEEAKFPFTPVGEGSSDYETIFQDFRLRIPVIERRLESMGAKPEVGLVLEPHLLYGGQLGGFTGPKYEQAIDALRNMLSANHIDHQDMWKRSE